METVLLFILGVVIFIVGVIVSIALHELGHLTFAKLFGVKVSQYMVGFGRTLWSVKKGETEYGIKAILLGGYISMAGMFPPGKGRVETAGEAIEDLAEPVQETAGVRRRRALFGTIVQDARDSSAQTMGDTDPRKAFYAASPWKRVIIMVAGPFMNLVIAVILMTIIVCGFGMPTATVAGVSACVPATSTATCATGDAVSPAKTSGLLTGDIVIQADGITDPSTGQLTHLLQTSAGKDVTLTVKRDGAVRTLHVTPSTATRQKVDASGAAETTADGKAVTGQVGSIGIEVGATDVPGSITRVLPQVWSTTGQTVELIGSFPAGLANVWQSTFDGAKRSTSGPVSIVGVGRAVGDVTAATSVSVPDRVQSILALLFSLNIALFVMNMLPLLPLDGGHVVGALWEMIKRGWARIRGLPRPGPVDLARLMPLTVVVVGVLVVLSAFLIFADLVNPISVT